MPGEMQASGRKKRMEGAGVVPAKGKTSSNISWICERRHGILTGFVNNVEDRA
jgi:hypothetical protein